MMKHGHTAFLGVLLMLVPAVAWSDPAAWQSSFSPQALDSYHVPDQTGVIVVRAGDGGASLDAAAAALRTGYTAGNSFKLVMDDGALGAVRALGDTEIVSKANQLPVSHVAVVRVFAGARGQADTAVVTVYDKAGSLAATFTVKADAALSAKAAEEPEPVEITDTTAAARPARPEPAASNDAAKQYEREFIWFEDVYASNGQVVARHSLAFQGRHKKELAGVEFYRAVGRDDLADSFQNRRRARWLLILGGSGIALGALAYAILDREDCEIGVVDFDGCMERNGDRLKWGVGLSFVGAGVILIGGLIKAHPVSVSEARVLADEHNIRLRQKLGLPEDHEAKPMSRRTGPSLHLSSFVSPGGGGVLMYGTF